MSECERRNSIGSLLKGPQKSPHVVSRVTCCSIFEPSQPCTESCCFCRALSTLDPNRGTLNPNKNPNIPKLSGELRFVVCPVPTSLGFGVPCFDACLGDHYEITVYVFLPGYFKAQFLHCLMLRLELDGLKGDSNNKEAYSQRPSILVIVHTTCPCSNVTTPLNITPAKTRSHTQPLQEGLTKAYRGDWDCLQVLIRARAAGPDMGGPLRQGPFLVLFIRVPYYSGGT